MGLLFAAFAAAVGPCAAAVRWAGTATEIHVGTGQEKAFAEFAFRNEGARAVRLVSLQPSCDCLTATASKESFAPGEAGVVRVEFTVGAQQGRLERFVTVTTDDPAEKPVSLRLLIEIPEPVAIHPRQLFWATGADPEPQAIAVTLAEPHHGAVVEAQCSDERFTALLAPAKSPGSYRLSVRPADTAQPAQATVRITAMIDGRPVVAVVVVGVR